MGTIILKNLTYAYGDYYKPIFKDVNLELDTDWKLGLIGRNGRGKTTLLNLIHGNIETYQGTIQKSVATEIFPYRYSQKYEKTLDLIKDNIVPYFELEGEMEMLLQEGTDAAYMAYASLVNQYSELEGYEIEALIIALFLRKNHFLLLDEPTNHLDIEGKAVLAAYLAKKKGFIIVSHDRNFLDGVIDHVLSINKGSIDIEKGTFSSWNHNRVIKDQFELRTRDRLMAEVKALEKAAKESRRFSFEKEGEKKGAADKGFVGARAVRLMKRAKNFERRRQNQLDEKKSLLKNYEEIPKLVIKQERVRSEDLIKIQSELLIGESYQEALWKTGFLIIFDEPLNYMDLFFREQLEKAIKDYEPTLIFVEHDAHFGEAIATKVISL